MGCWAAALPIGLTRGEEDDVICCADVCLVPAHGRITCLRAAGLYNEALSQQREEKKEYRGGEEDVVPGHSGVEQMHSQRCRKDICFSLGYHRLCPLVEGAQSW